MKRFEEPTRWLDARSDAPAEVRRLLAAGRDALGPTPEQLARLEASVLAAGGTGAAAAGTAGGAGKAAAAKVAGHALTKAGAIKLAAVLAVGGAGGAVGWSVLRSADAPPVVPASQASSATTGPAARATATAPLAPVPSAPQPAQAPEDEAPAATAATAATTATATAPPVVLPAPPVVPPAPPASAPAATAIPIAEPGPPPASQPPVAESELELLGRARRQMAADPADALRALEEHRARFPRGTFAQEREVLAIEALVRLGRRSEARARAAAFASEYPASAHRRRIAVLLGDDAGP